MANTTIPSELIQADVALGGSPTTTTQSAGNNTTKLATTAFVTTAVNNLIASAPGTMDTLNEIAAALNDDPDFTTTVNNAIATKLPLAGGTMTGNIAHAGSLTIDVGGKILLSADNAGQIELYDGTLHYGLLAEDNSNFIIRSIVDNEDILFQGYDATNLITALTLDMSDAGTAIFNNNLVIPASIYHTGDTNTFFGFQSADTFTVNTAGSERMRIDSSGRLLVGKSVVDNTTVGFRFDGSSGFASFVRDGNASLLLVRKSSDGDILQFKKDSSTVGSIGTVGGDLAIYSSGSSHAGLRFLVEGIFPTNNAGTINDDTVELGGVSNRFKNLYLSDTIGNGAGEEITFNNAQDYLRFDTSGSERMRIDSSGNLLVGTSTLTPNYNGGIRVHSASSVGNIRVSAGAKTGFDMMADSGGTGYLIVRDNAGMTFHTNNAERMRISSGGVLSADGVYNTTSSDAANVRVLSNGNIVRSTSSERYKNTITDASKGLTELNNLRPVTYKGNNDGDTVFYGLIAEEVHEAGLTEFVEYNDDNEPDALRYPHMVSLCIKAIQEQQTQIDALQSEINLLKGE